MAYIGALYLLTGCKGRAFLLFFHLFVQNIFKKSFTFCGNGFSDMLPIYLHGQMLNVRAAHQAGTILLW
jgi:hypothetical protein